MFTHSQYESIIFITGGIRAKNNDILPEFYECNITMQTMMPRVPMPEGRFGHAAVCVQEYLIVAGGINSMMHSMGLRATPVGEKRCFAVNTREL